MSASTALKPGEPVGAALRDLAAAAVAEARQILTDPARDSTTKVHDIRRALKRWRAFLRMLAPHLGETGQALRFQARDLARRLTVARDAQSAIDAFQDATEACHDLPIALPARSLVTIRSRLDALRVENERNIWTDDIQQGLSDYLTAAAWQVSQWNLDPLTFADLADMLTTTYRRARRCIPRNWNEVDGEDLHELRRRVVEHRYQMELIEPVWPRLGRLWVDETQRLRTRLGKYQDLEMLAAKAGPHQPLAHWRSKLAPIVAHRQADHVQAARRLAIRLFAEPPKVFRRRLEALWDAQADD
ncbi:MAG: CHAD domain-containing protein [Pseudorhodoplanes sp.]|uniref:CHAD domain-containing protein n=1 Tax=Pseudorhodoplanes sp. TaxID=1934341 RepID=UPI003D0F4226